MKSAPAWACTVIVTVALELPPPLRRTYLNASVPLKPEAALYVNPPVAPRTTEPPFEVNTSSIHPFEITGAPAGSVTNNNTSGGTLIFRVPTAAANYGYDRSIHFFGNTIVTVP